MAHDDMIRAVLDASSADRWALAKAEWDVVGMDEDEDADGICVCGKEHLRYLYAIRNRVTGRELYPIGSKCIGLFCEEDMDEQQVFLASLYRLYVKTRRESRLVTPADDHDVFSRKLLDAMRVHGVFGEPERVILHEVFNGYVKEIVQNHDYVFMLDMFNMRSEPTWRQRNKMHAIVRERVYPYLQERFGRKEQTMARINFNDVSETTGGGSLPNGPYVLKVVSASYSERNSWGDEQTYVELVFDVAEGPHAGALENRPDFAHTARLEFGDPKRLGILKHSLACISRSNTGANDVPFDAEGAFNALIDAGDPRHPQAAKAFEGLLFGGNVVQYHRPKKDGSDGTVEMVWTWYDAQEVRDGTDKRGRAIEPLEDKYKRGYTPAAQQQPAQVAETFQPDQGGEFASEDIPF